MHRKNIALEQLDGIRISLQEAVIRKELDEATAKRVTELLNQPTQLIETEQYEEAATAIDSALGVL
jgi:hypothetical protein